MYFEDYKKLQIKLTKVCSQKTSFSFDLVQMHLQAITQVTPSFKDESHPNFGVNHHFIHLMCWAQNFCIEATKELKVQEHLDKINELTSQKQELVDQLPSLDQVLKTQ